MQLLPATFKDTESSRLFCFSVIHILYIYVYMICSCLMSCYYIQYFFKHDLYTVTTLEASRQIAPFDTSLCVLWVVNGFDLTVYGYIYSLC